MTERTLSIDQTSEGWDGVVRGYEETVESLTGLYLEELFNLSGLQPGQQVLDVAAGTGLVSLAAAKHGADVLATDFSPLMIKRLEEKAAEQNLPNIKAKIMDGQNLDLPDNKFDIVYSNFGIIFFPEPNKGFQEMHRVLKPGGRAAVTTWSSPEKLEFFQVLTRSVLKVVPDFKPPSPPLLLSFQDSSLLKQSMENAGFKSVQIQNVTKEWPMPTPSWFSERVLSVAPPIKAMMSNFSEAQQQEILSEMTRIVQGYFDQGKTTLTNEAHIGVGTK